MTDLKSDMSNTAEKIANTAKSAADTASQELKTRAKGAADTIATEASSYAEQAKGTAANEVKGVASALRTAADEMRSGSPQERTFSQLADGLADASDAVRDKDLGEMVGSLGDFARRNPVAFLGGAALLGFAATRFLKASEQGAHSRTTSVNSETRAPDTNADVHSRAYNGSQANGASYGGQS